MRHSNRNGFTLTELLVVIAILAILAGLILAGVQKVRHAAARAQCFDRVRQLNLALHNYHDTKGSFPTGMSYLNGASPQRHMTWMTRILPHLEQESLWQRSVAAFEQEKSFSEGPHLPLLGMRLTAFLCPTDAVADTPWNFGTYTAAYTSYLGVSGNDLDSWDGILHTDSKVSVAGVSDGTSNTLIVGERHVSSDHRFGWWYAGLGQMRTGSADSILGVREKNVFEDYSSVCPRGPYHFRPGRPEERCDVFRFWSAHPGGGTFGFADGSARFVQYSADDMLPALATRAGGETAELP